MVSKLDETTNPPEVRRVKFRIVRRHCPKLQTTDNQRAYLFHAQVTRELANLDTYRVVLRRRNF